MNFNYKINQLDILYLWRVFFFLDKDFFLKGYVYTTKTTYNSSTQGYFCTATQVLYWNEEKSRVLRSVREVSHTKELRNAKFILVIIENLGR